MKFLKNKMQFRSGKTYIVPTRFGFIFLLVFVLMLLVGAIYANNMVFMMAFALFGLGNIAMVQTHNNISSLKISHVQIQPGYAEDKTPLTMRVENKKTKGFFAVSFSLDGQLVESSYLEENSVTTVHGSFLLGKRGAYQIKKIKVYSVFPYGLFVAWQWHYLTVNYWAYPKAEGTQRPRFISAGSGEDFSGHRDFREGDSLRHVNWKHFAKGRPKLIKEFHDGSPHSCVYNFSTVDGDNSEVRLQQLSKWITDAFDNRWEFGVQIGEKRISLGSGKEHLHKCLKELALYEAA